MAEGGMAISGPSKKSARNREPQAASPLRFLQLQKVLHFNGKALTTSWFKTFKLVVGGDPCRHSLWWASTRALHDAV